MGGQNFPSKPGPKPKKLPVVQKVEIQGLKGALKKLKFNPVTFLINSVYPQLEPEDQAKVLMKLIDHLYEKQVAKPTGRKIQNNINIGSNPALPLPSKVVGGPIQQTDLDSLIKIAASGHHGRSDDNK